MMGLHKFWRLFPAGKYLDAVHEGIRQQQERAASLAVNDEENKRLRYFVAKNHISPTMLKVLSQ